MEFTVVLYGIDIMQCNHWWISLILLPEFATNENYIHFNSR